MQQEETTGDWLQKCTPDPNRCYTKANVDATNDKVVNSKGHVWKEKIGLGDT